MPFLSAKPMLNIKVRKMKLVAQVVTQHIEMVKAGLSLPWIKSLFEYSKTMVNSKLGTLKS